MPGKVKFKNRIFFIIFCLILLYGISLLFSSCSSNNDFTGKYYRETLWNEAHSLSLEIKEDGNALYYQDDKAYLYSWSIEDYGKVLKMEYIDKDKTSKNSEYSPLVCYFADSSHLKLLVDCPSYRNWSIDIYERSS